MVLDKLKKLWEFIDKINSNTKTLVIIILVILLFPRYLDPYIDKVISKREILSEGYSLEKSPLINKELYLILHSDNSIENVILLNFHNTKRNPSGFSFYYLSTLGEAPKGRELSKEWNNLEYITYAEDINRIYSLLYLRSDSISELKDLYPNIYRKLVSCNIEGVVIYPLLGLDLKLGLLICTYKGSPSCFNERSGIQQSIVSIVSLLDYNNIKERFLF